MEMLELKIENPRRGETVRGFVFDEPTITMRNLRSWSDDKLHIISAGAEMGAAARSMIAAEMARRQAWKQPAGPAFWISCGSLLVSATAIVISLCR